MAGNPPHIVLIGCGKMGSALLEGWLKARIPAHFSVIDPHKPDIQDVEYFASFDAAQSTLAHAALIILAVKPQGMKDVALSLKPHLCDHTAVLSIAAGQGIAQFESYFSSEQPIIRAMPNTPAAIGKGATIAVANKAVTQQQKHLAHSLLTTTGYFQWCHDENILDAVTALSGSGPAYLFYFIEALTQAGIKSGLPETLAKDLSRQTVIGAAALAEAEKKTDIDQLRRNVTSPGGTTEAALNTLMDGRLQDIITEAVEAARQRGVALNT